jgi:predicted transcriptional regulator
MPIRQRYSFFIDPELLEGLKILKARTLAPEAAMIRQAISEYLKRQGVSVGKKSARRRVIARRKA